MLIIRLILQSFSQYVLPCRRLGKRRAAGRCRHPRWGGARAVHVDRKVSLAARSACIAGAAALLLQVATGLQTANGGRVGRARWKWENLQIVRLERVVDGEQYWDGYCPSMQ